MNQIENIASKHLGKAGDGSVVKPYITPDFVDSTLLVGIPRELNRHYYNILSTGVGAEGVDVWNAYEVSFLLKNGYPISCYVRIVYDSTSPNIVESKSIKLYLNSFNMMRVQTLTIQDGIEKVKTRIIQDLSNVLGTVPKVGVHLAYSDLVMATGFNLFTQLETVIDHTRLKFNTFNESPNLILVDKNTKEFKVTTTLLRSNCRVTNQPDWGDVYVSMICENGTPTFESFAQYIVSMRKQNHFHEEICECIYKRLYDIFAPQHLMVACLYTRRGGIDINPVRYSSYEFFEQNLPDFSSTDVIMKTVRQ